MSSINHHSIFENSKNQCLGKRDKSFQGRIDPRAVEICAILNTLPSFYTTSSCAGRCFLYQGHGVKATDSFHRFRVSHDLIKDPERYFCLQSLETDPSGGGDAIRTISQFDQRDRTTQPVQKPAARKDSVIWLRFEPFILHVACRSLEAASALMNAARPTFKNVGLTAWKDSRFLVAIWGDEGLEMPLTNPDGADLTTVFGRDFLASQVNERHERNWAKIDRLVQGVRGMSQTEFLESETLLQSPTDAVKVSRSYDVIGDIALLHGLEVDGQESARIVGEAILRKNKGIKVVAVQYFNLSGTERAPGKDGLVVVAGTHRDPLITTHTEYGIKCVVDLNHCFFSPRMGVERLRICQQVARGEHVLVLFSGVAADALQIAGRTEASSVVGIELNPIAVECARRAHRMLERNKTVKCSGAADRLQIIEGDVLQILPTLPRNHYDRILVPRPKEGALDGDLGSGDGGETFLDVLLPVLKVEGGECHWYDFAAVHEMPVCTRTRSLLDLVCSRHGLQAQILHISNAGSVAMRQLRVCVDFRVSPIQ